MQEYVIVYGEPTNIGKGISVLYNIQAFGIPEEKKESVIHSGMFDIH